MPQFMSHAVFPHVMHLLGAYDAEALFPPQSLDAAKEELIRSMEDHAAGAGHLLDVSV